MKTEIIDYRKLNLQSLDLLGCSGNEDLSKKIQWLQRMRGIQRPAADLSHEAALVTMLAEKAFMLDAPEDPDGLYVTETTTLNKWCGKSGLQVNGFSEWLKNYNGKVFVRKVDFQRTEDFNRELIRFIFSHLRDPNAQKYESGIPGMLELFLCELGIKKSILETAKLHCTEWIAELLKQFKLLADVISNNRMPPCSWWNEVCKKNGKCRPSLLDRDILVPISEPIRIK
jgi:hypothetical protein